MFSPRFSLRLWLVALFLCALTMGSSFSARAEGTFIPASGRIDFVHDAARGLFYIASGSQILRYRISDQTFLAPFQIGTNVRQLDLAPDGSFLVGSTPNSVSDNSVGFAYVDLSSETVSRRYIARGSFWGSDAIGTSSIALDASGAAILTANTTYGGWAPAPARYDFGSGLATSLVPGSPGGFGGSSFYSPSLHAAGDRTVVGIAENGISSGRFNRYDVGGAISKVGEAGYSLNGLAVNANGAQMAIPTYFGTFVYAGAQKVKTLGIYADQQGEAAAYHPSQARLYLPWRNTSQLRVYDSNSFRQVGAYDFESVFGADWNGGATVVHVSSDGSLLAATVPGGVRFVSLQSEAPRSLLAHGDNIDLDEDSSVTFDLGYSGGTPGAGVQFTILSGTQRGTLSGQGASRTYTPAPNANGSDEFTFRVTQGAVSSTARVFINIRSVNDAPVVANVSALTRRGRAVQILAMGTDVDSSYNAYFNWRVVTPPAHGNAVATNSFYVAGATFTYTPDAGFLGTDTFQVVANDAPMMGFYNGADALDSAPATVTVTVSDNGAPIANPDSYTVSANEVLNVAAPGVLANDTDPEGDALTAVFDTTSQPGSGTISLNANGSFRWSPYGFTTQPAQVTFRYAARDAAGAGDWTTVTLNLTPPVLANAQSVSLAEDAFKAITLSGSGPGVLSYSIATPPTKGLLSGTAPNVVYTPFPNYSGPDSFVFAVTDATGKRASATVSISVTPVADIPVAFDGEVDVEGETATTIWLRAFDGDDNGLTFSIVNAPAHGTLVPSQISAPPNMKAYVYRAEPGYVGDDGFSFRAFDGYYTSNTATMRLHVRAASSGAAPVALADVYSVARGQTLRVGAPGVLDNDSAGGGAPLRAVLDRGPNYASLFEFRPDGSFAYAGGVFPWQGTYASDSFSYHNSDGTRNSASVTVTLTVTPLAASPAWISLEANSSAPIALEATGPRPLSYVVGTPAHGTLSGTAPALVYTPNADYFGNDSFSFRAQNGDSQSATATVTIRVLAPWSVADSSVTARAGEPTPFALTVNDAGRRATLSVTTPPAHGTLSGEAPDLVYTAAPDYVGADSLTFAATVGAQVRSATVTFDVTPSNRAPVALGQSVSVDQDDELVLVLKGTDADEDALLFEVTTEPQHGTLSGEAPNLVYTPTPGYVGPDALSFTVSDGKATSEPALVLIRVAYVSYAPVAQPDSYETLEDEPLTVEAPGVLSNDSDANGDALTAAVRVQPENGEVVLSADGGFTYTPDFGFHGTDGFTYAASDGNLSSANARVTIRVIHVNHAPTAMAQNVALDQDTDLAITLAGTDPDGDALTFEIVSAPANGTLSGTGAARTFAPAPNFKGTTSFTFRAVDSGGLASAPATVSITVRAVNHAPIATAQSVALDQDTTRVITLAGTDPDGDDLRFEIVSTPANGTLSGTGAARTFAPAPGFRGTTSFTFRAVDSGGLASAPATVSITVRAVNHAPSATAQSVALDQNTTLAITLAGTDPDGDALAFEIVSAPANGSLSGEGAVRTFTPAPNFKGTTSFTFRARDGGGLASAPATVSITVRAVNRAPVATGQSVTMLEDSVKTIALAATDADGDALTFAIVNNPQHGSLSGSGNSRVYTPDADYFGADSFSFTARDGGGLASNTATVSLAITPVNDAPTFALASSALQIKKNSATQSIANFARQLSTGNAYETAQTLSFTLTNSASSLFSAQPTIAPDGTLTFTPRTGRTGTATVSVVLRDDGGTTNGGRDTSVTRTFTIVIK